MISQRTLSRALAPLGHRLRHHCWVLVPLTLVLFLFATANRVYAGPAGMGLEGVNISGAEWGQAIPGTFMVDYIFPTTAELNYFSSKGMTIIRVPFMWERMQPTAYGPLDPTYLGRLDTVVSGATAQGM